MRQPDIHPFSISNPIDTGKTVFDNGVTLRLVPLEDTRLVKLDFMFHGSKWNQSRPLQAYFASKLISASTKDFDADPLAEILDYYGAGIRTETGFFCTSVTLVCLSKNLPALMPVMKSILTQPTYDSQRFEVMRVMEKQVYAIREKEVADQDRCNRLNALYGDRHRCTSFAKESDYDSLTRQDLLDFHGHYFSSSDCQIWLTGDTSPDNIKTVNNFFGLSPWGESQYVWQAPDWPEAHPSHETVFKKKMDGVQSAIYMGKLLPRWDHPDFTRLMVAVTLLGGYFGSRLMKNIREEKGLTYGISSALRLSMADTALVIATTTANSNVNQVVEEIHKEIRTLMTEKVGEDELLRVKNYMTGYACRKYEPGLGLASLLMKQNVMGRPDDYIMEENNKVRAITADDIIEMTRRYFDADTMKLSIAGDYGD